MPNYCWNHVTITGNKKQLKKIKKKFDKYEESIYFTSFGDYVLDIGKINDNYDVIKNRYGNSFDTLCFADTYTEAVDLATKARVALDRYSGTVAGIEVQSIQYETSDEDFDIKGEGEGVYVQSLSFTLRQINPT